MKHGALSYFETVGDDLDFKWGKNFRKLCRLKSDETVVFAFVMYKSKAHRNQVNAKVHKDMEKHMGKWKMPFDMKRFTMGGFKALVGTK